MVKPILLIDKIFSLSNFEENEYFKKKKNMIFFTYSDLVCLSLHTGNDGDGRTVQVSCTYTAPSWYRGENIRIPFLSWRIHEFYHFFCCKMFLFSFYQLAQIFKIEKKITHENNFAYTNTSTHPHPPTKTKC